MARYVIISRESRVIIRRSCDTPQPQPKPSLPDAGKSGWFETDFLTEMMSENDSYVFNNNQVFNKRKQKATMLTTGFVLYVARYSYHNNTS